MSEVDSECIERMVNKLLDKAGKDPRLTPRLLREKTEQRLDLKRDHLKSSRALIKELICSWWKKNNDVNESNSSGGDGGGSKVAKNASRGLSNGGSSSSTSNNDNNNNGASSNSDSLEKEQFKALVKLARVSGCKNEVLSNLNESLSTKQKYDIICSRLRNKGLNFSNVPTEKEIAEAEKAYQLRKELESLQGDHIKTSSSTLNKGVVNNNNGDIVSGDNGYNHDINRVNKDGNNNENNRKRSFDETVVTRNREVKTKIETENNSRKPSKHQFTDEDEEAEF